MTFPKGSGIPAGGPGQGPPSGVPARRYTRPPFGRGNLATVVHGARTPRVYGELATVLTAGLIEDRPDLATFPEAVAAWATAEAQAALMRRHIEQVGSIDPGTGEPRAKVLEWLAKFERLAAETRRPLGLDPTSEAALTKERAAVAVLAVDLVALAERGREALAAREAAGLEAPDLAGEVLEQQRAAYAREHAQAAAALNGGDPRRSKP